MTLSFKNIGEKIFKVYLGLVGVWIVFALSFDIFGIYLHFTGQEERAQNISNQIAWKIDGTFKNNPDNIWYEKPETNKK
jgi:hypothetical protein